MDNLTTASFEECIHLPLKMMNEIKKLAHEAMMTGSETQLIRAEAIASMLPDNNRKLVEDILHELRVAMGLD